MIFGNYQSKIIFEKGIGIAIYKNKFIEKIIQTRQEKIHLNLLFILFPLLTFLSAIFQKYRVQNIRIKSFANTIDLIEFDTSKTTAFRKSVSILWYLLNVTILRDISPRR